MSPAIRVLAGALIATVSGAVVVNLTLLAAGQFDPSVLLFQSLIVVALCVLIVGVKSAERGADR